MGIRSGLGSRNTTKHYWRMVTLENRVEISIKKIINHYCFPKDATIRELQLHGFCDASEDAFAGVVYIRMTDSEDKVHTSLVLAKTKVAPIKRLTFPHLELCRAYLLTKILHHVREVLKISSLRVFAWTDNTIVLDWLKGNPRVGQRLQYIMASEMITSILVRVSFGQSGIQLVVSL